MPEGGPVRAACLSVQAVGQVRGSACLFIHINHAITCKHVRSIMMLLVNIPLNIILL